MTFRDNLQRGFECDFVAHDSQAAIDRRYGSL